MKFYSSLPINEAESHSRENETGEEFKNKMIRYLSNIDANVKENKVNENKVKENEFSLDI